MAEPDFNELLHKNISIKDCLAFLTYCFNENNIDNPRLEAEIIVSHIKGFSREKLFLNDALILDKKDKINISFQNI